MLKNKKGITLIALVVTIIVLLILAGVAIAMLTGENGIINRAGQARQETDEGEVLESIKLAYGHAEIGQLARKNENFAEKMQEDLIKKYPDATVTANGDGTLVVTINGTKYKVTLNGNVGEQQAITAINASAISIGTEETQQIAITTTPTSGNLEYVTYTYLSNDTDVATVDENGIVTGVGIGNTTITIRPSNGLDDISCTVEVTQSVGKFKTVSGKAYYYTGSNPTAGTEITASNMGQYLGKKVDYTTGGTYRIFYVDINGKYGNAGTIYLKADYSSSRKMSLSNFTAYSPSDISATSKLAKMNPDWYANRGTSSSSWNPNEHCAAYLCDPTTSSNTSNQAWASYFDSSKADFAIGSPSVEMYCDSYNKATHTVGDYILGASYRDDSSIDSGYGYNRTQGYIYTLGDPPAQSTISNRDYWTGNNTLDNYGYHNMYCPTGSNYWWLASPSSHRDTHVCSVYGADAYLGGDEYFINSGGLCPLVSLKSSVEILEVAE